MKAQSPAVNDDAVETALKLFADVKRGLEVNKSRKWLPAICLKAFTWIDSGDVLFLVVVGWTLAVDTLKACLLTLDAPETEHFMDEFFLKMITILTNQG